MKNTYLISLSLIFFLFFSECKKEKDNNQIPNTYVDFNIDITSMLYSQLNTIGNSIYVTGGVGGIVIYRLSQDQFLAYDRTCPLLSSKCQTLIVESSGLYIIDKACGSKFLILDGSPDASSTSQSSLRRYNTSYDGIYLRIYN